MSQRLTYEELAASNVEMGRGMMRLAREAVDKDAEIERLRAALSWIDNVEPELVASAEAKFGFKLAGEQNKETKL